MRAVGRAEPVQEVVFIIYIIKTKGRRKAFKVTRVAYFGEIMALDPFYGFYEGDASSAKGTTASSSQSSVKASELSEVKKIAEAKLTTAPGQTQTVHSTREGDIYIETIPSQAEQDQAHKTTSYTQRGYWIIKTGDYEMPGKPHIVATVYDTRGGQKREVVNKPIEARALPAEGERAGKIIEFLKGPQSAQTSQQVSQTDKQFGAGYTQTLTSSNPEESIARPVPDTIANRVAFLGYHGVMAGAQTLDLIAESGRIFSKGKGDIGFYPEYIYSVGGQIYEGAIKGTEALIYNLPVINKDANPYVGASTAVSFFVSGELLRGIYKSVPVKAELINVKYGKTTGTVFALRSGEFFPKSLTFGERITSLAYKSATDMGAGIREIKTGLGEPAVLERSIGDTVKLTAREGIEPEGALETKLNIGQAKTIYQSQTETAKFNAQVEALRAVEKQSSAFVSPKFKITTTIGTPAENLVIENYIREVAAKGEMDIIVKGSAGQKLTAGPYMERLPKDVDVFVSSPEIAANELLTRLNKLDQSKFKIEKGSIVKEVAPNEYAHFFQPAEMEGGTGYGESIGSINYVKLGFKRQNPIKIENVKVDPLSMQTIRKGGSAVNVQSKGFGPAPHRLKDITDTFANIKALVESGKRSLNPLKQIRARLAERNALIAETIFKSQKVKDIYSPEQLEMVKDPKIVDQLNPEAPLIPETAPAETLVMGRARDSGYISTMSKALNLGVKYEYESIGYRDVEAYAVESYKTRGYPTEYSYSNPLYQYGGYAPYVTTYSAYAPIATYPAPYGRTITPTYGNKYTPYTPYTPSYPSPKYNPPTPTKYNKLTTGDYAQNIPGYTPERGSYPSRFASGYNSRFTSGNTRLIPPTYPIPNYSPKRSIGSLVSKFERGFDVFVRRRGKFKKINAAPLSRGEAMSLGAEKTEIDLGATYKVRPAAGQVQRQGPPGGSPNFDKFYQKLEKGEIVYIQKAETRLSRKTEVSEIQAARRMKAGLGLLRW